MCGIAGWLGGEKGDFAEEALNRLKHRGPDAKGMRVWDNDGDSGSGSAGLLHARLKIIDLSPLGDQPMSNEDGTIWTAFNGEIYNHAELRRDLEKRGHRFRGRSDTEVIPHLYEEYGDGFADHLEGMFAIAVLQLGTGAKRLTLVRDRFGIKPLFYARTADDRLAFASEIRALRAFPGIDETPDPQAIQDYLSLLYIPAPLTFYRGIRALEPGGRLVAIWESAGSRQGRLRTTLDRYHQWSIAINDRQGLAETSERAAAAIDWAVAAQIESDVPLGAFLSGGIDSSLVCASAVKALSTTPRTFNARFADAQYDETWAARSVAEHIGSVHETLDIPNGGGTWDHITGLLKHVGQPFADSSLFPSHAICKRLREQVTVALSADGGDEGFGGYEVFPRCHRAAQFQRLPSLIRRQAAGVARFAAARGWVSPRIPERVSAIAGADDPGILEQLMCWVRPRELAALIRPEVAAGLAPVRRHFERAWTHSSTAPMSRVERLSALCTEVHARLVLPNDFLFKVDAASMREALEVRVPLLDETLFSLGLSLPDRLKTRKGQGKIVLRDVAARRLPQNVAAKAKAGFAIPIDSWVDADFRAQFQDRLLDPQARIASYLRPETYRPLVEAFAAGRSSPDLSRAGLYQRAVMLLALELHLEG